MEISLDDPIEINAKIINKVTSLPNKGHHIPKTKNTKEWIKMFTRLTNEKNSKGLVIS
jgi:hypothetical protein